VCIVGAVPFFFFFFVLFALCFVVEGCDATCSGIEKRADVVEKAKGVTG
jgi:hypothetical protein